MVVHTGKPFTQAALNMEILWFKLLALLMIFAIGLVGGLLPTRIGRTKQGEENLVRGNALSGGIFLGAGLLHMLPDAQENLRSIYPGVDFPLFALLCGIGFLLILMLEKAALRSSAVIGNPNDDRVYYPMLLGLVLSVHSVIAGASLGLEASLLSSIAILIAIVAHKGSAAFALGISMYNNGFSLARHRIVVLVFSLMTPLGVGLGTYFSTTMSNDSATLVEGIFDSLAAGTFLYIAVADIISDVFEMAHERWLKSFLVMAGFALMGLVAIWA
jgi:zinc transporter 1/2/3